MLFIVLFFATFTVMAMPVQAQDEDFPHGGTPGPSAYQKSPPAGVTPSVTVDIVPYLSFRPNPIGIGQSLLVNFWTTPPPAADRYLSYFTVTITNRQHHHVKTINSTSQTERIGLSMFQTKLAHTS
jgi:hypothetical protein